MRYSPRPAILDLLTPSLEKHEELLNLIPDLVAADVGSFRRQRDRRQESA